MLSHELGSRLGAAETALLLILEAEDPPSTERLRGLHELSLQSIRSGLDTVQGVRALFAVQDPESSVGSSDYPLGTLVRDIVHQVRIGAALRGVKIELASDDFDGTVDGERFPLAFYNLLNNAVRHHDLPDGTGTVRVAVSRVDGELHITVADDGPGLGDGVRDRLFSPDIREPSAEHPGLGLAIAWEAVRQMQGDLHVDPPNGRGTTFRIRVPVSPESSPAS